MENASREDAPETYDETAINMEIHKDWKKNIPYLYRTMISSVLMWPSLTVEWLSEAELGADKCRTRQKLLIGEHTSAQDNTSLLVAETSFPDIDEAEDLADSADFSVQYVQRVNVDMEINRARKMPQRESLVAVRTDDPAVCIYDLSKHPLAPAGDEKAVADVVLGGHTVGGFAVAWSPVDSGKILTAGNDKILNCYDILARPEGQGEELTPVFSRKNAKTNWNDIVWSAAEQNILAAVDEAGMLHILDTRMEKTAASAKISKGELYAIDASPFSTHVAVAGADTSLYVVDTRMAERPVHTLASHTSNIYTVKWSPHAEHILATGGVDCFVHIWDLSKAGVVLSPEESEDGPPELLFRHGGHTSEVSDISWNPAQALEIASVSADNTLQIWQLHSMIYTNSSEDGTCTE